MFLTSFFSQAGHAQKLTIKNLTLSKAYTPKELLNHTNSKVLNLPLLNYPGQKFPSKGYQWRPPELVHEGYSRRDLSR